MGVVLEDQHLGAGIFRTTSVSTMLVHVMFTVIISPVHPSLPNKTYSKK